MHTRTEAGGVLFGCVPDAPKSLSLKPGDPLGGSYPAAQWSRSRSFDK